MITIIVIENPIDQQLNDTNSEAYLDNFMLGAGITPEPGTEPSTWKAEALWIMVPLTTWSQVSTLQA